MTGWSLRHPPGADEEVARWTLDHPPQLQALRAGLREAVAAEPADLAEPLMIVATELAGNALRHGRPPTVVALLRADGHLLLDVLDHDPRSRPVVDENRSPGSGGLGLPLAERLAHEVGWYPTGTGKHVWATFAIPAR
jgi:serine/threonine-protein kinase RsbW